MSDASRVPRHPRRPWLGPRHVALAFLVVVGLYWATFGFLAAAGLAAAGSGAYLNAYHARGRWRVLGIVALLLAWTAWAWWRPR